MIGSETKFCVRLNGDMTAQWEGLLVDIVDPSNNPMSWDIQPDASHPNSGMYLARWNPQIEGEHTINITIAQMHIQGSPFICSVRASRNFGEVVDLFRQFRSAGPGEGELSVSNPRGSDGMLAVADRSNNRVQVFDSNGTFGIKDAKPV